MRKTRALILTTLLATAAPAWAATATTGKTQPTTTTETTSTTRTNTSAITIGSKTIFNLAPANRLSAQRRAEGARSAILAAITPEPGNTVVKPIKLPNDVQTRTINGLPTVTLKGKTIVTITKPDATANGISATVLADRWAQDLRDAIASLNITNRTAFQAVRDEIVVAKQEAGATGTEQATATDTQLATTIRNRLNQDATLKRERIDIEVQHGIVTLKGTVRDKQTEQRALETTRKVEGVDTVRSDLRIQGQ
jgi:osmotically-inducible protein OsmY